MNHNRRCANDNGIMQAPLKASESTGSGIKGHCFSKGPLNKQAHTVFGEVRTRNPRMRMSTGRRSGQLSRWRDSCPDPRPTDARVERRWPPSIRPGPGGLNPPCNKGHRRSAPDRAEPSLSATRRQGRSCGRCSSCFIAKDLNSAALAVLAQNGVQVRMVGPADGLRRQAQGDGPRLTGRAQSRRTNPSPHGTADVAPGATTQ